MVFKGNSILVLFVMMFLLVSSSYARFSIKLSKDEVKTICSKAMNPSYCYNLFKSTPQTKKLDLSGVGNLLIKWGTNDAKDVKKQFKSLAKTTPNPSYKAGYKECSELYDDAVTSFNEALQHLAAKDYASLNVKISAAMTDATTCKDDSTGPLTAPQLVKKISDINGVADIILIISNLL